MFCFFSFFLGMVIFWVDFSCCLIRLFLVILHGVILLGCRITSLMAFPTDVSKNKVYHTYYWSNLHSFMIPSSGISITYMTDISIRCVCVHVGLCEPCAQEDGSLPGSAPHTDLQTHAAQDAPGP